MKILVTGGAGYIGSQVAQLSKQCGHEVIVYDNLTTGFREALPESIRFILGDIRDGQLLSRVFRDNKFDAVIHFAAKLLVEESTREPLDYFENNVSGIVQLLQACKKNNVNKFVFSSTAAVYGHGANQPLEESQILNPINPYGVSKKISEEVLHEYAKANADFKFVILRYFNVAGSSEFGGQRTKDATHLVKIAAQHAAGVRPSISIFGNDYKTQDGTCVRDYIHILDLAHAHICALNYLNGEPAGSAISNQILNCGYGRGTSVREVLDMMQKVVGKKLNILQANRRAGDPDSLVANSNAMKKVLGWKPKHDSLEEICRSAYEWELKLLSSNFYQNKAEQNP